MFARLILLCCLLLSACHRTVVPKVPDNSQIDWQKPLAYAEGAIARHDLRLWIEARRGASLLGAEHLSVTAVKAACGLRYLPDSGDVYHPDNKAPRKARRDFARAYNRMVAPYCEKKISAGQGQY